MSPGSATLTRSEIAHIVRGHLATELKIEVSAIADHCVLRELPGAEFDMKTSSSRPRSSSWWTWSVSYVTSGN
jgi:hypothetical protein